MIAKHLELVAPEANDVTLRADLQRLIEERDVVQRNRDQTADAIKRASAFISKLEANVSKFADTNERIARALAEAFRRALSDGDDMLNLSLSPEVTKAANDKRDAENQLAAAKEAHEALTAELSEKQTWLDRLESDTRAAAKRVVSCYADHKVGELISLESEAGALRRQLLGLTQTRGPHVGPYPLSSQLVATLKEDPANRASVNAPTYSDAMRYWDSWMQRLTRDSKARPNE